MRMWPFTLSSYALEVTYRVLYADAIDFIEHGHPRLNSKQVL